MRAKVRCEQCGGLALEAFAISDLNRGVSTVPFTYMKCTNCECLFVSSRPTDLDRYYPEAYYTLPSSRAELAAWAAGERYKLEIVRRYVDRGRLVDVGPGSGGFCVLAQDAGFDVSAIEVDPRASQFLERVVGVEVVQSRDEAAAMALLAPADVITMWHVIEHLVDPWEMLSAAASALRPGGVLVIATPNPRSAQFRLTGKYWAHVDAPRHLWLIPMRVLVARAKRIGLIVRLATTRDPGSLGWNRFGWERTIGNRYAATPHRLRVSLAGRAAARLFWPIDSIQGLGAAYTLVLQKPAR